MKNLINSYQRVVDKHAKKHTKPILISLKVMVGLGILNAGVTKFNHWDSTLFLFEYEYQVPLIPWQLAAYTGTAAELILPTFVAMGLLGRPMALALFGFNAIAVISYPAIWDAGFWDHQLWELMILVIVMYGAGRWSVDQLMWHKK